MSDVRLIHGDCLDVLRELPDASVDAVVTDPPYGLGFMGKEWDSGKSFVERKAAKSNTFDHVGGNHNPSNSADASRTRRVEAQKFGRWCEDWTAECLRVLKPGGHLLAFGGTRTWHRLAVAVEDAGFEIRDSIAWMYGSGFPKSLDVSKAINATERHGGANSVNLRRAAMGDGYRPSGAQGNRDGYGGAARAGDGHFTGELTPDAERWQGWGTALKPAWESCVVGRKPLPLSDRIGSHLDALEAECKRDASSAARSSGPTLPASHEARTDSAPASAATPHEGELGRTTPTGGAGGSFEATDTSWSEWAATTSSNIVTSWKACWAELSAPTSTSTTSTTSGATTDLTTLWSSLSRLTGPSTLLSETSPDGLSSIARAVDSLFAAAVLNLNATRMLTATEPATSGTQGASQVAAGSHLQPIVVARKPLTGTVAANVLAHGTGALNIDGCRVDGSGAEAGRTRHGGGIVGAGSSYELADVRTKESPAGRWPANVVLDESQAAALDEQSGELTSGANPTRRGSDKFRDAYGDFKGQEECEPARGADSGGASRFFYVAKADASERVKVNGVAHPTVKPLALMRWLVRLVTPPGGTVLEPFAGSGTTVEACLLEGFNCIAIEREADYLPLIRQRIARRRDPVEAVRGAGEDGGLFDLLDGGAA